MYTQIINYNKDKKQFECSFCSNCKLHKKCNILCNTAQQIIMQQLYIFEKCYLDEVK